MQSKVSCPHCKTVLRLPSTAPGQTVRCPKCKQTFELQAPAGTAVTTSPVQPARAPRKTEDDLSPAGSFEDQNVPDDIQGDIRGQLNMGENIVWVGRPVWSPVRPTRKPSLGLTIIGTILTLLGLGGVGLAIYYLNAGDGNSLLFAIVPGLGGLLLLSGGVATLIGNRMGGYGRGSFGRRTCYVLTNQRVIIHNGGEYGEGVMRSFTAAQLVKMNLQEEVLRGIRDAAKVERLVRRHLIDPYLARTSGR